MNDNDRLVRVKYRKLGGPAYIYSISLVNAPIFRHCRIHGTTCFISPTHVVDTLASRDCPGPSNSPFKLYLTS